MSCKRDHEGVLLGVAEVKVPLNHLPQEEKERLSHICYRKLLNLKSSGSDEDEPVKCIGVIDCFYALQEVNFTIINEVCQLWRNSDVILKLKLMDVVTSVVAVDNPNRIIIMCRTENFGRTVFVLQMFNKEDVQNLMLQLKSKKERIPPALPRVDKNAGPFRRGAGSFGKAMGKKLNVFFTTLQGSSSPPPSPASSHLQRSVSPVTPAVAADIDHLSDYQSDEDEDDDSTSDSETTLETCRVPELHTPDEKTLLSPLEVELQFLLESETKYVQDLTRLNHDRHIISQSDFPMTKQEYTSLFQYVETLMIFHENLLFSLLSCKEDATTLASTILNNTEGFKVYVNFISNIPNVERITRSYSEYFTSAFPSLGENLRKPRMRLNLYVLSLESIQKVSPSSSMCSQLEAITFLKGCLKEAETRLIVDCIQLCPFSLLDHGSFVMSSELTLKRGGALQRRKYQVVVLQDLFILAKGQRDNCYFVTSFRVDNIQMIHAMRGLLIHLKVKRIGRSPLFIVFKTKSVRAQQTWINSFKRHQEKVSKHMSNEGQIDVENPVLQRIPLESCTVKSEESFSPVNKMDINNGPLEVNPFRCKQERSPSPLVIWPTLAATKNVPESNCPTELYNSFDDLLISEEKLIDRLWRCISSKNCNNSAATWESLYEMHRKYLYPATHANINKCDAHILCHHLLMISAHFQKLYSNILYLKAVNSYEENFEEETAGLFNLVLDNFRLLQKIISDGEKGFKDDQSVFSKALSVIDSTIKSANYLLKKKYVENFPDDFPLVLHEGWLVIQPNATRKNVYAILADHNLYILQFNGNVYVQTDKLCLEGGKISPPVGIKSFGVSVLSLHKNKLKYHFEAPTIEEKTRWLTNLEDQLPYAQKGLKGPIKYKLKKDPIHIRVESPGCVSSMSSVLNSGAENESEGVIFETDL